MTAWKELQPLIEKWKQTSLAMFILMLVCAALYPLIPTSDMWSIHRYIVTRTAAFTFGVIVFPGGMLIWDALTPGGSLLSKIGETEYGPTILMSSVCISMAMLLCYV